MNDILTSSTIDILIQHSLKLHEIITAREEMILESSTKISSFQYDIECVQYDRKTELLCRNYLNTLDTIADLEHYQRSIDIINERNN